MTTTAPSATELQQLARDHLWMHFTRMGGYRDADVPIIVRGDGCHREDANGTIFRVSYGKQAPGT